MRAGLQVQEHIAPLFWQITTVLRPGHLQSMKHGGLQVRDGRGEDANEADEAGNTPLTYLLERCASESSVSAKFYIADGVADCIAGIRSWRAPLSATCPG